MTSEIPIVNRFNNSLTKKVASAFLIEAVSIIGGSDATTEWPSVYRIAVGSGFCSGVFIDESHLLTAAHCLRGVNEPDVRVNEVQIMPDGPVATDVRIHENYGSGLHGNPDYDHDVALVRFDSDLSRKPARLSRGSPKPGSKITMVGFGRSDEADVNSCCIKRAGTNIVDSMLGATVNVRLQDKPSDSEPDYDSSILGSGDSGGPWFNDAGEVVAISSRGTMQSSSAVSVTSPGVLLFLNSALFKVNHGNR
jgi:S1-C subfamily serine protease